MADRIEQFGNSIIQHGKENDRIYLMKLSEEDMPRILDIIETLADKYQYAKIFIKVPFKYKDDFEKNGFEIEGSIPDFYHGETAAYFMSKYPDAKRKQETNLTELNNIVEIAKNKSRTKDDMLDNGYLCRKAKPADTKAMAELYSKVFASYPFPIQDKDYLIKTMNENVVYFGVWKEEKLIALSSSEMDVKSGNAEMTDFAVDPEFRGSNLSIVLLSQMEKEMKKRSMELLYTIARAKSYGMNITFAKMGYCFAGRLKNNTNICGSIESMNLWYKRL
ncbi:putative beta-lysine N-acetyltransferase [Mobilitalea sibirica]|uniref:Putative beta-lysine N-acetyltransferase n=1 Tax=Mobilitalea sibirica TaxID=1462919 RepID=A0A8J7HBX4_9FIRM|nr:putative beta-lysine N-acetyltransferase [Mobilitalea sibirica]MBH1939724.1 putative beta-lysine N-acetyltransferase [Mobilitalea sibirica]